MGNVITINEGRPDRLSLALSNQGTRVFLDLLVECALSRELTWSQFDLIDFLCDRININITAPGTVSFDIEEMPWDAGCVCEDKLFILNLTEMAKDPQMWKTLVYQPEEDIVFPWLDTFAQMIGMFSIENSGREYPSDPRKSKLHFKKGPGWKACFDEEHNVYTAERSWRGFYQLTEIDRDTYERLGTDAIGNDSPTELIGRGREMFQSDDDYYTMPYCWVRDEHYAEIAPWSDAIRRAALM